MVEVQYVDFGNRDILSVKDLRQIKDEFLTLPAMVRTDERIKAEIGTCGFTLRCVVCFLRRCGVFWKIS